MKLIQKKNDKRMLKQSYKIGNSVSWGKMNKTIAKGKIIQVNNVNNLNDENAVYIIVSPF